MNIGNTNAKAKAAAPVEGAAMNIANTNGKAKAAAPVEGAAMNIVNSIVMPQQQQQLHQEHQAQQWNQMQQMQQQRQQQQQDLRAKHLQERMSLAELHEQQWEAELANCARLVAYPTKQWVIARRFRLGQNSI